MERQPTPIATHKGEFVLDVVYEQSHIVRQIEIGNLEDQRIAEDRLTADAIQFAGAQSADWSRRSTLKAELSIDTQKLVHLNQL